MLCMLFESLRHYDFDTFSHEMQTSQDPNFIFDTQLHIPHETLHIHTQPGVRSMLERLLRTPARNKSLFVILFPFCTIEM